jgi:hypothetical protein
MVVKVKVEGLTEWRKAMAKAGLADAVKDVNQSVAQFVVDHAERKRAALQGRYKSYSKVRIKAGRTQAGSQVTVGPKSVGFAGEFGAYVHPVYGRDRQQSGFKKKVWPMWRSGADTGYLVFPTLREKEQEIADLYEAAVDNAMVASFPE